MPNFFNEKDSFHIRIFKDDEFTSKSNIFIIACFFLAKN